MKKHLNTLFVTTQGAYLAAKGETVSVRVERETKLRVPLHMLDGIVCFGKVACSPALLGLCGENDVAVSFLSLHGRFLARVQGPVSGNVLLRREQYRRADDPQITAELARAIVLAKVANSRAVLLRGARDSKTEADEEGLRQAAERLSALTGHLESAEDVDSLRGLEGEAARVYFSVFDRLVGGGQDFCFEKRSRRPPLNRTNSLLSFVYTLLVHDVAAALESVGLDPAVGFLHRDRPGRPSLALDLMEEFRSFFADRLVLSLINRRQVQAAGFTLQESGAVWMDDETRKTVLTAYQKRKQETIRHPFLGEDTTVGLLFHLQARLLAAHLRDDLDGYPPMIWR